jgi:hypothetical protein
MQNPKSCRKYIWPRVISVQSVGKPMPLEPQEAQLVLMTIACVHKFLSRSPDSAAIYPPPDTFDYEENGGVIEGSWGAMSNENMSSLFPVRKIARKPNLKVKQIGEELAAYFVSGGRAEWKNDCP